MKIIHLATGLRAHGIEHRAHALTRHLGSEHDISLYGAVAIDNSALWQTPWRHYVLHADLLDEMDLVYMEVAGPR